MLRIPFLFVTSLLFLLLASIRPQALSASPSSPNWHENSFFGIHYDFHASATQRDIGAELTPQLLKERLLRVRPDWIHADCKGVYGYTSWPTKIGSTAPGLAKDMLRIFRQVTRELGIRLGVHYCALWDERALELNPDWSRVDAKGKRDRKAICLLSDYDEKLMIPQMLEVIDTYDVDGFWVDADNWWARPCWCKRCKAEFQRRKGLNAIPTVKGQAHWQDWLAFHRDLLVEHVTKYTKAIHSRKSTCMVTSNWMYCAWQPDGVKAPIDYLSGDTAPQHLVGSWTADGAALEGRVFDSRNMSWDLMPWIFDKSGRMDENPPFVTRPAVHLKQEVAEIVALGGAVMVYEQPQSNGWLTGWHHDTLAEVAEFARERKDACFKSKTVPQAAILHLADHFYSENEPLFNFGDAFQPVLGAFHALLETHHSTDVLLQDEALKRLNEYKLVVVPEQTRLNPALLQVLETFARSGGYVLISGERIARDYPDLVGASPHGEVLKEPIYLPVTGRAVAVSAPWQPVTPSPETDTLTYRLNEQDPEKNRTDQAVVTKRRLGKGAIVAVHGQVFRDYARGHYPLLRQFIAGIVNGLPIPWQVTVEAPPNLELVLRQKENKLLINLINRGAGEALSPTRVMAEQLPPVENVTVRVRQDQRPKSVSLVPANMEVEWEHADGVITIKVPRVEIHRVLMID
jgi:hypothetical protein